ncbi:CDP-alcohol phosphatidyltransferase family protein [Salinarimonas soli]|uniref:CDP-diacylglycerol--glycerol-3-phosphate 3-phosphatidyltransferase n=1 Tax=Salinarimonas soli TaxID=1638099 RepID=A0A5B2VA42_9HYPH|nr:CDP-alcohol phosphatidyltransferase family protein [Salinarimonas soli]KAA2235320.1 CDP-alcohol phosphatidyltransferase family protein [Salinarimonas soli]
MTIPNLITVFRLVLVPLVVLMILQGRWGVAFAAFVVAGVSDGLDGYIARRFDMRSEFGAIIDPLADKALLVSIYITLAVIGVLPDWVAVVVVSRDVIMVMAIMVSWLMERRMEIRPMFVGKANTAAQIGYAATILATKAFGIGLGGLEDALMIAVAVLTVLSGGAYLGKWLTHMTA